MRRLLVSLALGTLAAGVPLLASSPASAGLDSCGNIHVEANAQCEVVAPSAECEAKCTPITVEASCAAELKVSCDGQCSASASVECSGSCTADCTGKCEVDPGSFDCRGECTASCDANCAGSCSSSANKSQCEASCKATCSGDCNGSCEGTPPSADCNAKCEASCSGKCEAEANIDCQIDCQSSGYAKCEVDVQGGCTAACKTKEGALFCDGQYVDAGNNLSDCVAALEAAFNIKVTTYAEAECSGNSCTAEAGAEASCSAAPVNTAPFDAGAVAAGVLGIAAMVARRRKQS